MPTDYEILLPNFLAEAKERIDQVEILLMLLHDVETDAHKDILVKAKRELHTLKGNAGMMGFKDLQVRADHVEDLVSNVQLATPNVQDSVKELDRLRLMLRSIGNEPSSTKIWLRLKVQRRKKFFATVYEFHFENWRSWWSFL